MDGVKLTFVVQVPPSTPPGAPVWISGNLPALGSWNGAGVRLDSLGGGRFAGGVTVERGAALEFKVTRGSWETVEKDAAGGEIANRRWQVAGGDTVRVTVGAWRDQTEGRAAGRPVTLTGDIRRHPGFPSRFVRSRDVLVYLPPGYAADSTRRYPVLYFHDGNNVFDGATSFIPGQEWGVDETAERLIRSHAVPPFIAVAIANSPDRMAEYTPAADARHGGGHAGDYARFLIEELKPFVDSTYRTLPAAASTGVVGSSLGGIVSLWLGLEHPEVFRLVGCISPAAWWADGDIIRRAAAARPGALRIWLDIGTREGGSDSDRVQALAGARALREALEKRGEREGADFHYEEVEGAEHNERAWAARVDRLLRFLLAPAPAGKGR